MELDKMTEYLVSDPIYTSQLETLAIGKYLVYL